MFVWFVCASLSCVLELCAQTSALGVHKDTVFGVFTCQQLVLCIHIAYPPSICRRRCWTFTRINMRKSEMLTMFRAGLHTRHRRWGRMEVDLQDHWIHLRNESQHVEQSTITTCQSIMCPLQWDLALFSFRGFSQLFFTLSVSIFWRHFLFVCVYFTCVCWICSSIEFTMVPFINDCLVSAVNNKALCRSYPPRWEHSYMHGNCPLNVKPLIMPGFMGKDDRKIKTCAAQGTHDTRSISPCIHFFKARTSVVLASSQIKRKISWVQA